MPKTAHPVTKRRVRGSRTGRPIMVLLDLLGRRWALRILWELRNGALAYFRKVNEAGGVHGRRLELVTLDDANQVPRAEANTKELVEQKQVFALFGYASATLSRTASMPCSYGAISGYRIRVTRSAIGHHLEKVTAIQQH